MSKLVRVNTVYRDSVEIYISALVGEIKTIKRSMVHALK
jgi:hypothetical protein